MKTRGFTLTEILGVITLLAVIFALVYPNVMNLMESSKKTEYEEYLGNIYLSTEAYVNSNTTISSTLNEIGSTTSVNFSELLSSGYLNSKLVNPKTGETVATNAGTKKVTITVGNDRKFVYVVEE